MPRMDQSTDEQHLSLAKLLLIGDGKIGKTDYAAMAAAAGFNLLYIDGDVGAQTIKSMGRPNPSRNNKTLLTPAQMGRIHLLPVGDNIMGGVRSPNFIEFMQEFTTNITIRWNDTQRRIAKRTDKTDEIWEIKPAKMDSRDLIVLDAWTGLTESIMLQAAVANSVDLSTASTKEMRPVYQSGALKATAILQIIRAIPCHVIVIAHPDEFAHLTKPEGRKVRDINESDMVVDWTKMIPKSTSKPHGLQMPKYFTDVAWMEVSPSGTERRLNFKVKNDRVSGGHFNDSKNADEYSFAELVKRIGGTLPKPDNSPDHWLTVIPAGEHPAEPEATVLDGANPKPLQNAGMRNLFAAKEATTAA